jgi:hypothetical protein
MLNSIHGQTLDHFATASPYKGPYYCSVVTSCEHQHCWNRCLSCNTRHLPKNDAIQSTLTAPIRKVAIQPISPRLSTASPSRRPPSGRSCTPRATTRYRAARAPDGGSSCAPGRRDPRHRLHARRHCPAEETVCPGFIEHGTSQIDLGWVTASPTGKWTVEQARDLAFSLG